MKIVGATGLGGLWG